MKVAVPSTGKDLNAPVDPRFGRSPYIVVVDTETMDAEGLENPGALAGTGAGIAAAQLASDADADAVICSVIGPHAYHALNEGQLKAYASSTGSVREVIERFKAGELELLEEPNTSADAGKKRKG